MLLIVYRTNKMYKRNDKKMNKNQNQFSRMECLLNKKQNKKKKWFEWLQYTYMYQNTRGGVKTLRCKNTYLLISMLMTMRMTFRFCNFSNWRAVVEMKMNQFHRKINSKFWAKENLLVIIFVIVIVIVVFFTRTIVI